MRNFVITSKTEQQADGVALKPGDEIAIVSTHGIPLMTVLGMIQFQHADVQEIADDEVNALADAPDSDDPGNEADADPEKADANDSDTNNESDDDKGNSESEEAETTEEGVKVLEEFTSLGLDEKIAHTLVELGETPESIGQKAKEGYDLCELEGIGKVRADKILDLFD